MMLQALNMKPNDVVLNYLLYQKKIGIPLFAPVDLPGPFNSRRREYKSVGAFKASKYDFTRSLGHHT